MHRVNESSTLSDSTKLMERIESFAGQFDFLSNFAPAVVKLDGVAYPSVEHAYQAAKAPGSTYRRFIQEAATAGVAKKRGRLANLRPDWEHVKLGIMLGLLRQKFSHEPLRQRLLDTGSAELVEGNWWGDTYWGICKGVGENHLGKLLMQVRNELSHAK